MAAALSTTPSVASRRMCLEEAIDHRGYEKGAKEMAVKPASLQEDATRLPWTPLLAMPDSCCVVMMTETMPAGLLTEISKGLSVSESAAGQLVSLYAVGNVLAAIPAIAGTRKWRRKSVFVLGVLGFVVANAVTALSGSYALTLAARVVAGAFSGLLWGMIPGYARQIAPARLHGRALAIAMTGTPAALALGTPLGTLAGSAIGWRWAFAAMSVIAVLLIGWVLLGAPDAPGEPADSTRTPVFRVALMPGVLPVLAVVLAWMTAHNVLYTYIAPYLAATGVPGRVSVVLLVFGLVALVGIWLTGIFVDTMLRWLTLCSLSAFGVAALALGLAGTNTVVFYGSLVMWGLTFGGASTLLNTAAADAATGQTDSAAALVTTVWNSAIFAAAALGAVLLATVGPDAIPWTVLGLMAPALIIVLAARRHAFTPGPRDISAE